MSRKYQPALLERVIDEQQIAPRRGGLYQLSGGGFGGKTMRSYAEAWAAIALLNGEYVHWIDGACRFNPARIIKCLPSSTPEANNLLHNLFVGRGFTVHQFSALIERLASEISITKAKLVVIDGPVVMHLDEQVKDREARALLKKSLKNLAHCATKYHIAIIVITSSKPYSKRHATLLKMIEKNCSQRLSGRIEVRGKTSRLRLLHYPSGASGYREIPSEQETLQQSFNRVFHQQIMLQHGSDEEIESLIEMS